MPGEAWEDVLEKTRYAPAASPDRGTSYLPADDDAPLPGEGDRYKAAGRPAPQPLTRLCCIMGKEGFRTGGKAYRFFQYVHLDSDTDFGFAADGQAFTLRFAGTRTVEVTVRGRNLLRICDYIHLHRMPWIRVADRDFADADGVPDHQPIITGLTIEEVTPPEASTRG